MSHELRGLASGICLAWSYMFEKLNYFYLI
jgi:hypothetical protein